MPDTSPVKLIADAIREAAAESFPEITDDQVDQVIADTVAALWPPQPQATT